MSWFVNVGALRASRPRFGGLGGSWSGEQPEQAGGPAAARLWCLLPSVTLPDLCRGLGRLVLFVTRMALFTGWSRINVWLLGG